MSVAATPFVVAWIVLNHFLGWQPQPDFVLGFAAAGVIGFIYFRLVDWNDDAGAHKRPQFVSFPTRETPEEVMRRAAAARIKFFLTAMGVVLAAIAIVYMTTQ